jgi:hypothetical protein
MFIVIEKTAQVSGFLALMTVMTVMTMIYGLILDRECVSTS